MKWIIIKEVGKNLAVTPLGTAATPDLIALALEGRPRGTQYWIAASDEAREVVHERNVMKINATAYHSGRLCDPFREYADGLD